MTRITTYYNPLGLRIGEVVKVRRTCEVDYNGNEKILFYRDFNRAAIIVGCRKCALGTYHPGKVTNLGEPFEAITPCLKVSRYIWLYKCRTAINKIPFFVHPDDITRV